MALHHSAIDIRNDGLSVRDIALKLRNDGMGIGNDSVGVHDIVADVGNDSLGGQHITMDVRNGYICVYCEFGLEVDGQRGSCGRGRTHIKDMKNPVEIQSPGRNHLFVVLRVEHP